MSAGIGNWTPNELRHSAVSLLDTVALTDQVSIGKRLSVNRRSRAESTSFPEYRFPPDVILLTVCWYLRYGLSYRAVEELLAERGIKVHPVIIYRWAQRFTPARIDVYISKRLYFRCAVCEQTAPRRWRFVATRSPRTCDTAITNSARKLVSSVYVAQQRGTALMTVEASLT